MAFRAVHRTDDPKWKTSSGQPSFGEALADFILPSSGLISRPTDGYSTPTAGYAIASGESFDRGDLVRINGSDELTELTAVTQTVKGVALEPVINGAAQGPVTDSAAIALVTYTNPDSGVIVYTRFAVTDVNATVPSTAHVGSKIAIALSGGEWYIDISDTANQDVEVIAVDSTRNEFIVEFLAAAIQS